MDMADLPLQGLRPPASTAERLVAPASPSPPIAERLVAPAAQSSSDVATIAPRASAPSIGRVLMVGEGLAPLPTDVLLSTLRRHGLIVSWSSADEVASLPPQDVCDVLLVDAAVGRGEPLEWIRQLRQGAATIDLLPLPPPLPLLLLGNARDHAVPAAAALAAGANDCLAWPFDPVELVQRLANLTELSRLRRSRRGEDDRVRAELAARSASLDGLIETGLMMSMERDRSRLLRCLLEEGRRLLHCDGGTMYLVTPESTLRFELRTRDDSLPAWQIPLFNEVTGRPNENYVSVYTALRCRSVLIDDVYSEARFDLSGTRAFDAASGYHTVSMLTVPIAPRGGEAIGVLQFMNAFDRRTGHVVPFPPEMVSLVEALAAQAAVALDNLNLVESQKQLMESLIRVLATAIDAKSPYTGRHCERVPELAFLLAEAACRATEGPLAAFAFRSEEEWQEGRSGAWRHDCGKVTTPEHVIDKATKLETIHNRIHEVRMRFEVLLRDVEIERLRERLQAVPASPPGVADDDEGAARHAARRGRLIADFAFVAQCNIGSEAMGEADVERLAQIGAMPWIRHLDDRLGLSDAELDRLRAEPAQPLPATEALLADRPRDVVARRAEAEPDPSFKFRMAVPEHLYHHGELYNLGVRSGTLTPEERYKINEHMVHTITMLEGMPFPKHLRRVPEYAGTHHERMDGKGYPRRLSGEALSVPSRIMAVADIFEALTASDRPYKKAKTLSEALGVLRRMAGAHIDVDIYNLFLSSGVFLEFARKHLDPEQIDVLDGSPYLLPVAGATPLESAVGSSCATALDVRPGPAVGLRPR